MKASDHNAASRDVRNSIGAGAVVLAATGVACVAGMVAFWLARGSFASAMAYVVLPIAIVIFETLGLTKRWRAAVILAALFLDAEAILAALVFASGGAFAVLLPLISVGFAQLHPNRTMLRISVAAALPSSLLALLLAVYVGPISSLVGDQITTLVGLWACGASLAAVESVAWIRHFRTVETLKTTEREVLAHAQELESTREILTAIMDASPFSIISTDLNGNVQYFNPASERLIGIKASEAVGKPVVEATRVTQEEYAGLYERLIQGEVVRLDPMRRYQRDGTPIDERSWIAPLTGSDGTIVGAVSITEDVTEKLQLEAELGQAQKMETLGQLSGAIAHDFNNLLQAIHGYAELAALTAPKDSDLGTNLHEIQRAADRATELTRQLLAFSQPSLAGARIVNVNDCINEAVPMIRRLVGPTIALTTILDPNAGYVMIDPTRLEQAVLNLSVNGRDAMPSGGSLTIETHCEELANMVTVSVSDTGSGMPSTVLDRIFEPFFTTKEVGQGTGLGLPIVRRIVNGAGGQVTVQSAIGQGTTFILTLPTVPGETAEAAVTIDADMRGTETILLVEDEASIRRLAMRVLGDHGYVVHAAANADEARMLWNTFGDKVDLLLSDVTMPGLSGPAFAAELSRSRRIRTLFVSGHLSSDQGELRLAREARFLQKPFTVAALLRAVRETASSRHARPSRGRRLRRGGWAGRVTGTPGNSSTASSLRAPVVSSEISSFSWSTSPS